MMSILCKEILSLTRLSMRYGLNESKELLEIQKSVIKT